MGLKNKMEKESSLGFRLAILSFISGFLSSLYFLIDYTVDSFRFFEHNKFYITLFLPILMGILGIVALVFIHRNKNKQGKWFAILGIILNAVPAIITIAFVLFFIFAFSFGGPLI
tara:strand:- start:1550 stop:1894 length:345 start_codon:yes stop_codon:yes gene_type:complete